MWNAGPVLLACIAGLVISAGCGDVSGSGPGDIVDYRAEMREFVQDIGAWARAGAPGFIVIPQNGHELLTQRVSRDMPQV